MCGKVAVSEFFIIEYTLTFIYTFCVFNSSDWSSFQKHVAESQVRSCITPITKGLRPGSSVTIIGKPFWNASNVYINFSEDPVDGMVSLHFNPRFKDKVIVINTRSVNEWGKERRFKIEFPFEQNNLFVLFVKCGGSRFHFILNGKPIGSYKYRTKLEFSKYLKIFGDLIVYHVAFDKSLFSLLQQNVYKLLDASDTANNPAFRYGFWSYATVSLVIGIFAGLSALVYKWMSQRKIDADPGTILNTDVA